MAQKDIRFARTVQRLQRSVITELEKVGIVHLYTLGYRDEDLVGFKLVLNNPSKIAELQEMEHWKTKFDIAGAATDGYFSKQWIAKKIFGLSDEEFQRCRREMFYDRKYEASLEAAAEAEQAAASAAAAGGAAGGDMGEPGGVGAVGGEPELEVPTDTAGDLGGGDDAGAPADDAAAGGGGDDGGLLAAPPGKREDDKGRTTTAKSHGWYSPRELSGGDRRKTSGPRKKNMNRAASPESGTSRSSLPGAQELLGLARGTGVYAEQDTSYSKIEELKLLKDAREIKALFESLETMKKRDKNETEA